MENNIENNAADKADFGFFIFGRGKDVLIQANMTGLHATPTYLNELYNAITKARNGDSAGKRAAYLHILPQTPDEKQRVFNFQIIG